jgi:hypothetical protein
MAVAPGKWQSFTWGRWGGEPAFSYLLTFLHLGIIPFTLSEWKISCSEKCSCHPLCHHRELCVSSGSLSVMGKKKG